MIDSRDIAELHPALQRGAKELTRRMREQGYPVGISSTYRDKEAQDALYAQGRTKPGNIVTNAKGGQSIHNYRLAFDVYKNISGQAYSDNKFFSLAGQIWEEMGGEWGGSWTSFVDTPHMQYTGGLTLSQLQAGKALPEDAQMLWEEDVAITNLDEALKRLAETGVVASPDYWLGACRYINYLELLLINAANRVEPEITGTIGDPVSALEKITAAGVILSPEYWVNLLSALHYLPELLVSIANHL